MEREGDSLRSKGPLKVNAGPEKGRGNRARSSKVTGLMVSVAAVNEVHIWRATA